MQWVGRDTERKNGGWGKRGRDKRGVRNKVKLDFHMDKFTQGSGNKAAIRAIESMT